MNRNSPPDTGLTRRSFLKGLAGFGLGATAAMSFPADVSASFGWSHRLGRPGPLRDRIGLQLYTVRDLLQEDFEGTIERVAKIGYRELEFAGYYGRSPQQVRALLDRLGLKSPSAHIGTEALRSDLSGQIAAARTIGHDWITLPSYPVARTGARLEAWQRAAEEFNRFGQACHDHGLRFAYHNHAWEFQPTEDGRTGYDVLVTETDPALVDFELDLYWAVHGGHHPLQLFRRYPGRFTMWHVKDIRDPQETKEMTPVGQGEMDFAAIFASAEQSGMQHFFVEHDNAATTIGSLASIEASFRYLNALLT
jgi:sugar phosphate isomerase/epimerase